MAVWPTSSTGWSPTSQGRWSARARSPEGVEPVYYRGRSTRQVVDGRQDRGRRSERIEVAPVGGRYRHAGRSLGGWQSVGGRGGVEFRRNIMQTASKLFPGEVTGVTAVDGRWIPAAIPVGSRPQLLLAMDG